MPNTKKINSKRKGRLPGIEVVDLFCGIGGLSYGIESSGQRIPSRMLMQPQGYPEVESAY